MNIHVFIKKNLIFIIFNLFAKILGNTQTFNTQLVTDFFFNFRLD